MEQENEIMNAYTVVFDRLVHLGLGDSATTRNIVKRLRSDLPSLDGVMGEFDLIWSESAIYSIGRANAFAYWRPLLKPDGWLVFSDIVWQYEPTGRSDKATAFWAKEYPDLTTADAIIDELIAAGFNPLDPVLSSRESLV